MARFSSELVDALRAARRIAVLTGAGVSAESGLPTFRDPLTGLWARYRPEDLATPEAFARDPTLVWAWYRERRAMARRAEPNPAHGALARLETLGPSVTLVTQNVDDLHRRAGSREPLELHGNLFRTRCTREGTVREARLDDSDDDLPRCRDCGGLLRPDVVWFGEPLPGPMLERARRAADACDVFLSVGTSHQVYPAAALPALAAAAGARVVVVDPGEAPSVTGLTHLRGRAGELLPDLVAKAWP
jgi:NAD-dependent deacetylase